MYGRNIVSGHGCSALALATKRNHLEVMKVLLKFGANTLEEHYDFQMNFAQRGKAEGRFAFPHHSVISQVCSVPATNILLEAGAACHINRLDKTGYTPLEMIIYRCSQQASSDRFEIPENEALSIIQLLLENGASPRRMENAALMPYKGPGRGLISGPLLASMALRSARIFEVILGQGSAEISEGSGEYAQVLKLALRGKIPSHQHRESEASFCDQVFLMMLRAGLSPNEQRVSGKRLISHALSAANKGAVAVLFNWETHSGTAHPQNMPILSEIILASALYPKHRDNWIFSPMVQTLLGLGANINQPSFWPGGFPPLLLAASENIAPEPFEQLLRNGAEKSGFFQLSPGHPYVSVWQCLLNGYPLMANNQEIFFFKKCRLSDLRLDSERRGSSSQWTQLQKRRKFDALIASGVDPSFFQTRAGDHILIWAVKRLRGLDLLFAVESLLPHYQSPSLPNVETPLLALFYKARRDEYLAFGTLHQLVQAVRAMVEKGVSPKTEYRGETVLHRVCRLGSRLKSAEHWNRVTENARDREFDYSQEFLNSLNTYPYTNRIRYAWHVEFSDLLKNKERYEERRSESISNIIRLLVQHGANLEARDHDGIKPIDLIKADKHLRDRLWQLYLILPFLS